MKRLTVSERRRAVSWLEHVTERSSALADQIDPERIALRGAHERIRLQDEETRFLLSTLDLLAKKASERATYLRVTS